MLLDGFQPTQININTDSESCRHSLGKLFTRHNGSCWCYVNTRINTVQLPELQEISFYFYKEAHKYRFSYVIQ